MNNFNGGFCWGMGFWLAMIVWSIIGVVVSWGIFGALIGSLLSAVTSASP